MKSNNDKKWTVADILTNFGKSQAQVQQEKQLKQQLKEALMQNQAQALGQFVPGMEQQMPPMEQDMSLDQSYEQAKQGGIHIDPSKKGTFKAQATRMGMGIQEAAEYILSNKDSYSSGMVRKANFARNFAKEEGGTINNPGFNALPKYVQENILSNMEYGGDYEMDQYKNGGYTVRRSNDRKGKTHVVTGPDGTKKYFGDPNMGERGDSKYGKDAFYARHADSLKKNPYFRAYAKATWADGGTVPSSPEQWGEYIKSIESQVGNPASWTLEDYNMLQNALNQYKNWRETTPEGQAVVDYHNEPGEYEISVPEHLQGYVTGMMKSKLAYANEFGNPAAKRMIVAPDNPYNFRNGMTGTHYMSSMDDYAVPQIQNQNGQLMLGDYGPESNEAMRFNNPAEAQYFAEHYKQVSPAFNQEYRKGGEMIKRADGSYSQRGLWDNIRANKGSGRKPTREMIEQERKLRRKAMGGMMGPSDCDEGFTWNDTYQTCVPIGQEIIDPQTGENYLKDWYSKRLNIINNPGYAEAIGAENVKDHSKWLNRAVPAINEQLNDVPYPSAGYVDEIEGEPNATGEYIYDDENPMINIKKSVITNPQEFAATQVHEGSSYANTKGWDDIIAPTQNRIIDENIKPWERFLKDNTLVDKSNKNAVSELENAYDYSVNPEQDNIHSNVHATRYLFNLQPDEIITEDKINSMIQEGTQKGYLDKSSPNYHDDFYRLVKLSKDKKSFANLFNLLASNDDGLNDNDLQMTKHGGNVGKLRKFL